MPLLALSWAPSGSPLFDDCFHGFTLSSSCVQDLADMIKAVQAEQEGMATNAAMSAQLRSQPGGAGGMHGAPDSATLQVRPTNTLLLSFICLSPSAGDFARLVIWVASLCLPACMASGRREVMTQGWSDTRKAQYCPLPSQQLVAKHQNKGGTHEREQRNHSKDTL